MGHRARLLLAAAVLALAGCGSPQAAPPVQPSQGGTGASASPTPSVAPVYRVTAPDQVGARKKYGGFGDNDPHPGNLAYAIRTTVEEVTREAPAYGAYGIKKDGNQMMFAAVMIKQPTRAQVSAIVRGLANDVKIVAADPGSHGEGRTCSNATVEGEPGALCTWRDERSIGVAVFPGQRPAGAVRDDFASLQGLAIIASSVSC
jgi:hypothetical protein